MPIFDRTPDPIWHEPDGKGGWRLKKGWLVHTDLPGGGSLHPNVGTKTMVAMGAEYRALTRPTAAQVAQSDRAGHADTMTLERYRALDLRIQGAVKADLDALQAARRTELAVGRVKDAAKIETEIATAHGYVIDADNHLYPGSPDELRARGVPDEIADRTQIDWAGALFQRFATEEMKNVKSK